MLQTGQLIGALHIQVAAINFITWTGKFCCSVNGYVLWALNLLLIIDNYIMWTLITNIIDCITTGWDVPTKFDCWYFVESSSFTCMPNIGNKINYCYKWKWYVNDLKVACSLFTTVYWLILSGMYHSVSRRIICWLQILEYVYFKDSSW